MQDLQITNDVRHVRRVERHGPEHAGQHMFMLQDRSRQDRVPFKSLRAAQMVTGKCVAVMADVGEYTSSCVYCPVRPVGQPPAWWKPLRTRSSVPLLGVPIHELMWVWLFPPSCIVCLPE
jgi:hypothetical protein